MLEQDHTGRFEYIFLVCPTFEDNKTYRSWKYENDENYIVIPCDQNNVDDWLKYITTHFRGTDSLIILDDCASGNSVKGRTSELVRLGFSARHYGFSTIVITQQLTSIAKPYRENISKLVSFYNPNRKDMQEIFDNYLGEVSKEEEGDIKRSLKELKYSRLEISLVHPYGYKVEF